MRCGFVFAFSFFAEVQLFRPQGQSFSFSIEEITFADEFGNKFCGRIMINIIRIVVLFDNAFIHYDDAVRHGQCLFLIVRYIDEGQTQTALKVFQFQLQIFAQLVIQRAQRLVQ